MSTVTFKDRTGAMYVEVAVTDEGLVVTGHGTVGPPDRKMLDFLFDRLESYRQMLEKEEDRLEEEAEQKLIDADNAALMAEIRTRLLKTGGI